MAKMTYAVQDGEATELDLGVGGAYRADWRTYGSDWIVVIADGLASKDAALISAAEYDLDRRLTDEEIIARGLDVHAGRGSVQDKAAAGAELDRLEVEVSL